MARVQLQVLAHPGRVTIRWSDGENAFEPYHLEDEALRQFWNAASEANARLAGLVQASSADERSGAAYRLAAAGRRLHQSLLAEAGEAQGLCQEIRHWLAGLQQTGALESLEVIGDTLGRVPWNVVYETDPNAADFGGAPPHRECWRHFWGVRYALTETYRYNPLRTYELLQNPEIVLAADPAALAALPDDARQGLQRFAETRGLTLLQAKDNLAAALRASAPDVLYLFCPAAEDGLRLGGDIVTAADLRDWLQASEAKLTPWNGGVLIANPPADPAGGSWSETYQRLLALRFGGLVCPQVPLPADDACRFGIGLLERLINAGDPAGVALQNLRAEQLPCRLTFVAACPPRLQVYWGEEPPPDDSDAEDLPLPAEPYRPLVPCDREERMLLAARDDDIAAFAELVDAPQTRLALLHGRPGVGKSSLLRAGVVPLLDHDSPGYLAVRSRIPDEGERVAEEDYPVVSVRATQDLAGQLALALCAFAAAPYSYTTPTGRTVTVDLPGLLAGTVPESATAQTATDALALRNALLDDSRLLGRLLQTLAERLPRDLLLLIEQGEELFTLSRSAEDVSLRNKALAMLAAVGDAAGHARIVLSLRTEYFGRMAARLRQGGSGAVADYLLSSLSASQLVEVIERPTLAEPIAFTSEVPFERYRFRFAENLARRIAVEAIRAANEGVEEALPLVQVVCYRLWVHVEGRTDRTIAAADLDAIGGVAGAIGRYVEGLLRALTPTPPKKLWPFLQRFCRRQPDGLLTRDLVTVEELNKHWKVPAALGPFLEAASSEQVNLLQEITSFRDGDEVPQFSLAHDALTPVVDQLAAEQERRRYGWSRVVDTLWIMIPLAILLVVVTFVVTRARLQAGDNEAAAQNESEKKDVGERIGAQWARYAGLMQGAATYAQVGDSLRLRQSLLASKYEFPAQFLGFEWYHFWHLANSERKTLLGHLGEVTALAASRKGNLLASASYDGKVRLWDMKSLEAVGEISEEPAVIHALAFAPNGKYLAVARGDATISIYEFGENEKKAALVVQKTRVLKGHTSDVTAVAFAADSTRLLSAGADRTVKLWDVRGGEEKQSLSEHTQPVRALAVSPKGDFFASGGDDGKVILWEVASGKKRSTLEGSPGAVAALTISPDGDLVFAGGSRGQGAAERGFVRVWNVAGGKPLPTAIDAPAGVLALALVPEGREILTGGKDRRIRRWDLASATQRDPIEGHFGWVSSLVLSPNADRLFSGAFDSTVKVWDLPRPPSALYGHKGPLSAMALSPDGKLLASGGSDGHVRIWDLAAGKEVKTLDGSGVVVDLNFAAADNRSLLAVARETSKGGGVVQVWDVTAGKISKELKADDVSPTAVVFTKDGKRLFAGDATGGLRLWNVETGTLVRSEKAHAGRIRRLVISADSRYLASAGDDGVAALWPLAEFRMKEGGDKSPRVLLEGHIGPVHAAAFFSRESLFLSAGADGTVKVWLPEKATELYTIRAHSGAVTALALSPAGGSMVTAGEDGRLKFWSLVLLAGFGTEALNLADEHGHTRSLLFTRDRGMLLSAGDDGVIRIRRAAPEGRAAP